MQVSDPTPTLRNLKTTICERAYLPDSLGLPSSRSFPSFRFSSTQRRLSHTPSVSLSRTILKKTQARQEHPFCSATRLSSSSSPSPLSSQTFSLASQDSLGRLPCQCKALSGSSSLCIFSKSDNLLSLALFALLFDQSSITARQRRRAPQRPRPSHPSPGSPLARHLLSSLNPFIILIPHVPKVVYVSHYDRDQRALTDRTPILVSSLTSHSPSPESRGWARLQELPSVPSALPFTFSSCSRASPTSDIRLTRCALLVPSESPQGPGSGPRLHRLTRRVILLSLRALIRPMRDEATTLVRPSRKAKRK